jgi:hypothetical protein
MSKRKKGPITRKKRGSKGLSVILGDWLAKKPYKSPTTHDYYYLKLSNEICKVLIQPQFDLKPLKFNRKNIIELSVVISSYIEDFASEIGIWKGFTDYNKEKFGFSLPFFEIEKEEYFEDDLNPQDISYIVWHYASVHCTENGFYSPHFFREIGEAIYDLIEPQIKTLSVTNFYENYLTISDNHNFFDLKEIFKWLSTDSYLLGVEFKKTIDEFSDEVDGLVKEKIKEAKNYAEAQHYIDSIEKILYTQLNQFLYHTNSKYGALNTPIWLSKIVRASENVKTQIADFQKYEAGNFQYKGKKKEYYLFEARDTGKVFKVALDSFQPGFINDIKVGYYVEMALFYWGDKWYLSGAAAISTKKTEFDTSKPLPIYLYKEDTRNRLFEMCDNQYAVFIEIYKNPLVLCQDENEVDEVTYFYHQKYRERVAFENGENINDLPEIPKFKFPNIEEEEDLAIFFDKIEGLSLIRFVQEVIRIANKDTATLTDEEVSTVFNQIYYDQYTESLIQYLIENYPNIEKMLPRSLMSIDLKRDGKYLRSFNEPRKHHHFPKPLNSIIDPKRVDIEGFKGK